MWVPCQANKTSHNMAHSQCCCAQSHTSNSPHSNHYWIWLLIVWLVHLLWCLLRLRKWLPNLLWDWLVRGRTALVEFRPTCLLSHGLLHLDLSGHNICHMSFKLFPRPGQILFSCLPICFFLLHDRLEKCGKQFVVVIRGLIKFILCVVICLLALFRFRSASSSASLTLLLKISCSLVFIYDSFSLLALVIKLFHGLFELFVFLSEQVFHLDIKCSAPLCAAALR